ncbi:hypothetical protein [Streptomyces sp. WMMB303]|uniref:hypothetical protein n=1 Tax=Streptomyces sp. WMMB303 TaxID=3034154 RepID=UPI0023EB40C1|nr:hypothetical protein [Streptomyces sp. WMMB303]MDF4252204.1 hypothetical protein [Streptomyces sp. WMMB303]
MFVLLLVAGTVVILAGAFVVAVRLRRRARAVEAQLLERRFGPEYTRVLARRHGDTRTTRRELAGRLDRYGSLAVLPLSSAARERYLAQWRAVQEDFVDSPVRALAAAETLLERLAEERGYPAGLPLEERLAALSVHHARRVQGYRKLHDARRTGGGTASNAAEAEDLRAALLEGRALFDSLLNARATGAGAERGRSSHPGISGGLAAAHRQQPPGTRPGVH